jgi:hypothetical protein
LFAVAGCNSIFGSHDVINGSKDADLTPKDAAPYTMFLIGTNVDTTSNPDPTLVTPTTVGLATTTNVMAGKLGQPLMAVDNIGGDGSFTIPFALAQDVYRIVYTPPDGVPVEIQGKIQNATFMVPSLGRPNAMAAPANAVLGDVTPTSGPNPYVNLHLFSIGTFAVRLAGQVSSIGSSTIWSTNANQVDAITSLSGGLDTPESAKGDRIIVVDGVSTLDPGTAGGFSIGTIPDFSAGFASPTMTRWKTRNDVGVQTLGWSIPSDTSQHEVSVRVTTAAPDPWTNDNGGGTDILPFIYAGGLPTTKLPNFVESGRGYGSAPLNHWAARGYGGLGVPMYLPLSTTASNSTLDMVHVFNGTDAPAFPPAMFMRFSRSKMVEGVTLTTGIQTIAPTDNMNKAEVSFSAGLANQAITLNGVDIFTDITGTTPIPNAPAQLELAIAIDQRTTTDDCMSTVYEFETSSLVPVHRYLSAPNNVSVNDKIMIDKSVFAAGHDYILGISCHHGLPGVTTALDWSKVSYPFTEAVTWSLPFNVQ